MSDMKSYTDLEQSRKLAGFLPIESADMFYWCADHYPKEDWIIEVGTLDDNYECICAWSLAALLSVIRKTIGYTIYGVNDVYISCELGDKPWQVETEVYDNEVDACYEMIIKLHELNLL